MTPRNIREQLERDEGRRLIVYLDTLKIPTVGIGHKVLPRDDLELGDHIDDERCDQLFDDDCHNVDIALDAHFAWGRYLDDARRGVLQNLLFNMGLPRLSKFVKMLGAMEHSDWHTSAAELLNSAADHQEPERIWRLATQLESGVWV